MIMGPVSANPAEASLSQRKNFGKIRYSDPNLSVPFKISRWSPLVKLIVRVLVVIQ